MAARRTVRGRRNRRRVVVVVSRYNEGVTRRLLEGALQTLAEAGWGGDRVDVVWVPGAFELPLAVDRALSTGRYRLAVALGAVVRGETPHFEYVSRAAAEGLSRVAIDRGLPVGFGVLTCDTLEQALARAGGDAGNKGSEAAAAALEMLGVIEGLEDGAAH
ncbi:MAG: 6,7-dimethyl-8-ribityllumazine synthase [Gemmatimonadales bacterium]|nr:MAG: 6,7-dimethyl-8-ribityllumazine synthase [Gemmatimonadales bacterium]